MHFYQTKEIENEIYLILKRTFSFYVENWADKSRLSMDTLWNIFQEGNLRQYNEYNRQHK